MMTEEFNPSIPFGIARKLDEQRTNAYTLYWDFVIDGTASMASLYPAVYLAAGRFLEWMKCYDVKPKLGITVIRSESEGYAEKIEMEDGSFFTEDGAYFLKKIKYLPLYGGDDEGKEAVEEALSMSLKKFPEESQNRGVMVFTDSYHSRHTLSLHTEPVGVVTFFCPPELFMEEFDFSFITPEGETDEEGTPFFMDIRSLFEELTPEYLDNIIKPYKDMIKGVSIGFE